MDVSSNLSSSSEPEREPEREPEGSAEGSAPARSRAATRARLLEAGGALFAERGLHGVTSHDIAKRAGVAAGTFYLHFADKAELFREIAMAGLAKLRGAVEVAVRNRPDVESQVRANVEALVGFAEEERDLIRILFSPDAEAAAVESDLLDQFASNIAAARQRRIDSGEMPPHLDPAVLSQALVGMWARVIAWWAEDPARADRERVIETLVHIQLNGTHPPSNL